MKPTAYLLLFLSLSAIFSIKCQTEGNINSQLSFGFIENKGQIRDQNFLATKDVKFLFPTGKGLNVQLKTTGFSYDFYKITMDPDEDLGPVGTKQVKMPAHQLDLHRIDIEFLECNRNFEVSTSECLETFLQFPKQGKIRQYKQITYHNIYPLIDVIFHADPLTHRMKYDFVVHPGGDEKQIKIQFKGFENGKLIDNQLQFNHSLGVLTEVIPASWLIESGERLEVKFEEIGAADDVSVIGFSIPASFDRLQTLVIDPEPMMVWGTYLGDSLVTIATGVTTDKNGKIYTCGSTQSMHSLATSGAFQTTLRDSVSDAFLMKFNQYGTCEWATYFGGNNIDFATDIAADTMGHVYLFGTTYSDSNVVFADSLSDSLSFQPIQDSLRGISDAFLVKFKSNGDFVWSTYLGGGGAEQGAKMALDFLGNVYLTGTSENSPSELGTSAAHQPTSNGGKDAFITKIDTIGAVVWSTYFGGSSNDFATGISYGDTNVYVSGYTYSTDSISTLGSYQDSLKGMSDGYIAKLDGLTGQRIWSTYFGGSENDYVNGIKAYNEVIYFVGTTLSEDFIASDSFQYQPYKNALEDAFIGRILGENGMIYWSTYFGGDSSDYGLELDIEMDKQVIFVGTTQSENSIATDNVYQSQIGGGKDLFLAKFDLHSARLWATYYGGPEDEEAYGVDVFGNTSVYVVGSTQSDSLLLHTTYYAVHQDSLQGITNGFLTKFIQNISTLPSGFGGCTAENNTLFVCEGDSASVYLIGAEVGIDAVWAWYKDDCGQEAPSLGFGDTLVFYPTEDFNLYVRAETVTNSSECVFIHVVVVPKPVPTITSALHFCVESEYVFASNAAEGYSVQWFGPNSFFSEEQHPTLLIQDTTWNGVYELVVTNQYGCSGTISSYFSASFRPVLNWTKTDVTCFTGSDGEIAFDINGNEPFIYTLNGIPGNNFEFLSLQGGNYTAHVTDSLGCTTSDSIFLPQGQKIIIGGGVTADPCVLNSGMAYVTVDGDLAAHEVSWMPIEGYGDTAYYLPQGNQTAFVSIPNGCKDSVTFSVPDQIEVNVQATPDSAALFLGETLDLFSYSNYSEPDVFILWTPSYVVNCDTCASPLGTPIDSTDVIVYYTHVSGCVGTDTVKITIKNPCGEIFIPTAFSPNGDGLNDEWCIYGGCLAKVSIRVFNQWGEVLFASYTPESCWDGTYQGEMVQNDVYMYQVTVTDIYGVTTLQNGNVAVNY